MTLIVQKYGGTSVGSLERITAVAHNIAAAIHSGHQVVTVVSAMGQETDRLKDMALALHPSPPSRELDMLLTAGERVSMSLLAIALHRLGITSISLTGSQSGILTDRNHGNARITAILGDRIRQALQRRDVAIIAGFQGMNPESKDVTTLGRGGSDLTAVALAYVLGAEKCQIYTDVAGVCTADPRLINDAKVINVMTWDALTELSWSGAGVMHSRAAHLAAKFAVPLEIRSSFNFAQPGTVVKGHPQMENAYVTGLTYRKPIELIQVSLQKQGPKPTKAMGEALSWLWKRGETPAIAQSSGTPGHQEVLLFAIHTEHREPLLQWLRDTMTTFKATITEVKVTSDLAALTIVGQGFWQQPEKVAEIIEQIEVAPDFFETRNTTLTFCIKVADLTPTLRKLHECAIPQIQERL